MNLVDNIGISYRGDYIRQGSQIDKIKQAIKLKLNNVELYIRDDGKDFSIDNVSKGLNGNVCFHLPTISNNLSNLNFINDIAIDLLKYNIKFITLDASTLLLDTFEFSTLEEQKNYIKNIASGIAKIASNNIVVAIENVNDYKGEELFGKNIENISDLVVYTKEILVNKYEFTREKAENIIGVSLNLRRMETGYENWFKVFKDIIKCIKLNNNFENIEYYEKIFNLILNYNINVPIFLQTDSDIEEITNEYRKIIYLVTNKMENKPLNFIGFYDIDNGKKDKYIKPSQSGFTNILVITMIILTIIIAILMFYVRLK